jgi:hypothetical protein
MLARKRVKHLGSVGLSPWFHVAYVASVLRPVTSSQYEALKYNTKICDIRDIVHIKKLGLSL